MAAEVAVARVGGLVMAQFDVAALAAIKSGRRSDEREGIIDVPIRILVEEDFAVVFMAILHFIFNQDFICCPSKNNAHNK